MYIVLREKCTKNAVFKRIVKCTKLKGWRQRSLYFYDTNTFRNGTNTSRHSSGVRYYFREKRKRRCDYPVYSIDGRKRGKRRFRGMKFRNSRFWSQREHELSPKRVIMTNHNITGSKGQLGKLKKENKPVERSEFAKSEMKSYEECLP